MNILGSLGGGAQLCLGNLTGMTLGNLNAVLIGGTATLPSKEMFLGSAFQDGYFPRQWAAGTHEQGELVYCKTNIAGFFFDAVLNVSTEHTAVVTSHPVQTGANISDHMYLEPVQITMEIGMSDCMASMVRGQWVGAYTKSISAYRKLCELQAARIPFTVLTRLNQYQNMVIRSISVNDDASTLYGLRATVNLQQLILANVTTEKVSAREWTSGDGANRGEVQPTPEPTSTIRAMEDAAKGGEG